MIPAPAAAEKNLKNAAAECGKQAVRRSGKIITFGPDHWNVFRPEGFCLPGYPKFFLCADAMFIEMARKTPADLSRPRIKRLLHLPASFCFLTIFSGLFIFASVFLCLLRVYIFPDFFHDCCPRGRNEIGWLP